MAKKRLVALAIVAGFLLTATTGCGPEGQPCKKGSFMMQNGKSYHCKKDATGNYVWHQD